MKAKAKMVIMVKKNMSNVKRMRSTMKIKKRIQVEKV